MSKVIKNNDGVAIVEGTPAASLVKDVDRFFASKPPERMAGESISQPRKLDPRAINTRSPITREAKSEENTMFIGGSKDFNERTGSRLSTKKAGEQNNTMYMGGSKDFNEKGSIDEKNKRKVSSGIRIKSSGFGNSCPDPNMLILMADGSQKKAIDLVVGDLLKTNHEESFELGEYKVEYVNVVNDVQKIKLIFDKTEIVCSLTHKFLVNKSWKEAKDMKINDEVSGKKLLSTEKVEDGDVVHITVEDAHTYICEGLLSHNKRMAPKSKDNATQRPVTGTVVRRNEAKNRAENRRKKFFERRRSKKEAQRSQKEQEATQGKFVTTLGR